MSKMPVLFVGHGSPMNLIADNTFTQNFQRMGRELPMPKAILCVSAHWETSGTKVQAAQKPKQIYDFSGFPEALYQIKYEPSGAPAIAAELSAKSAAIEATTEWGLDHGTWAVLHQMYPAAEIPVFQLSLNKNLAPKEHLRVARELSSMRDHDVLIFGSGNIVHNLRRIEWEPEAAAHPWAEAFEEHVIHTLLNKNLPAEEKVERIFTAELLSMAHPSLEHLLPLVYSIGAAGDEAVATVEVRGIQNAAISMAAFSFL